MDEKFKRISDAILNSGYSYSELSKLTGISKSSLQRYATGETKKIPLESVEAIASATGRDARYLMCWDDEKIAPTDDGESEKTKKIKEIIEKASQLGDSDIVQLDNFVSFLIAQTEGGAEE